MKARYVPIFKWTNRSEKTISSLIKDTMRKYNLTDILLFRNDKDYYAISFKTIELRRVEKILRCAKSENLTELQNNKQVRMPVSKRLDPDDKEMNDVLFVKEFKSQRKKDFTSKGHVNIINNIFKLNKRYDNMHGENIKLTLSRISVRTDGA